MPTYLPHYSHIITPVDRTTIRTRLTIHPDLLDDPDAYSDDHDLTVWTHKASKGHCNEGPTRNLKLDVLTYGGIQVKLRKVFDNPLTEATIHFNPGVCLFGDNGSILSLQEFLEALGLIVTHLRPILQDPEDWIDLIPGLREGGVAYWASIEVPFQCDDTDGALLAGFRHLSHPAIRTAARHWRHSIQLGTQRSALQFALYHKDFEMLERGKLEKDRLEDYDQTLRLEARMKGDKLVEYFGNERNVEKIGKAMRLVRFYPEDLVRGHRKCFSEMKGVFFSGESQEAVDQNVQQLTPLGKLLARVALNPNLRNPQTFPELLTYLKVYTEPSDHTMSKIRKAGLEELSRLSTIRKEELFSDAAYQRQHSITGKNVDKVSHELDDMTVDRRIFDAYVPPGLRFWPMTELPSYYRV